MIFLKNLLLTFFFQIQGKIAKGGGYKRGANGSFFYTKDENGNEIEHPPMSYRIGSEVIQRSIRAWVLRSRSKAAQNIRVLHRKNSIREIQEEKSVKKLKTQDTDNLEETREENV